MYLLLLYDNALNLICGNYKHDIEELQTGQTHSTL